MTSRTRLEFTARTSLASGSGASDRMWLTTRLHTVHIRRFRAGGTTTSSSVRLLRMDMCAHSHTRAPQGLYPCSLPPHTLPQPLTVVSRRSPKLHTPTHSGRPPSLIFARIHPLSPTVTTIPRPSSPSARPTHNRQLDPPRVLRVHGHGRVLHREELEPARERGAIQSLRYRAPDGETGPGLVLPKRVLSRCESA